MNRREQRKQRGNRRRAGAGRLFVGAGKHHPSDAIREFDLVKVNQQTERHIQQLHIAEKLGLMDWKNRLHGFDLHQQAIFNKDIEAQVFFKSKPLVFDQYLPLRHNREIAKVKFSNETLFVNTFN